MNSLIRKVWGSVIHRSGASSGSNDDWSPISEYDRFLQMLQHHTLSAGEFDRIPIDIFMQILRILGPRESARLRVVCKSWRFIVSDNRLWIHFLQSEHETWNFVFFAETHLRSDYPIQVFPAQACDLSFMHIYSQRMLVPGAVIIDGGSGYCKYGWSKFSAPSGRSATFLEFGNIESPMPSRLRHFFSTICKRMHVKTSTQPIVVSIPLCHCDDTETAKRSRRRLKEVIYSTLFDMNVPVVCAINQATLALFASKRTSGIVVNVGFHQTSVVPILNGKVMHKVGVEVIGIGALKLTGFLKEQMQQKNIHVDSLYTVRTLKENLCYVALDYEDELSRDRQACFGVSLEGWFTLSEERFKTGEILFRPRIAGMQAMGLHQAVSLCMDHCHDANLTSDDNWYKTVVLAGGSACLPGLAERLEKELYGILPTSLSSGIQVLPPSHGADSAWFGAKLVSNLSTFPKSWCMTKKQFKHWYRCKLTQ